MGKCGASPEWQIGNAGATLPKRLGMLFALVLAFSSIGKAQGQSAPGVASNPEPGSYYTNKGSLLIPFSQDPNDKRIHSVLLHVSDDFGRTWRYLGYAQANQRSFPFRAPKDGWFWFAVQTQDKQDRYYPSNMNLAVPGLKICVDTVAPQVFLKGAINAAGSASLDWEIRDEAVDLQTLRVESRSAGSPSWTPLGVQPLATGGHVWNPGPGQVETRLLVRDKSGNLGEQNLIIVPGQTKTAGVQGSALPTGAAGAGNGLPPNVLMVNHKRFQLNFKVDEVGPSDISRIEVWYTRNGGQTWNKYPQDAEKSPPCILEVPEEGRYGFTLVARSGVDLGEPAPRSGDLPHIWVEVDETKPQLKLLSAEVGRGVDQGTMTFVWTAADRFLGPTPITISYATSVEGPWTPTSTEPLANTGRFVWKMPEMGLPFQFFAKLECVDQAGNKSAVFTNSAVKVDLATPKARVVGVEAIGLGAATAPGGTTGLPRGANPTGSGPISSGNFGSPPNGSPMAPATPVPPEPKPMVSVLPPSSTPMPIASMPPLPMPIPMPIASMPPLPMPIPMQPDPVPPPVAVPPAAAPPIASVPAPVVPPMSPAPMSVPDLPLSLPPSSPKPMPLPSAPAPVDPPIVPTTPPEVPPSLPGLPPLP